MANQELATQAVQAVNNVAGAINNAASGVQGVTTNAAASAVQAAATTAQGAVSSASDILKGYLIRALDATGNVIDKAVDMVQEQAPLLVKEVLHWYFAYNLIFFIIGVIGILSIVGWWLYQLNWSAKQSKLDKNEQSSWYKNYGTYDIEKRHFRIMFNVLMTLPLLMSIHLLNLEWLKIYIAPRLWLIEYTAKLVKASTGS